MRECIDPNEICVLVPVSTEYPSPRLWSEADEAAETAAAKLAVDTFGPTAIVDLIRHKVCPSATVSGRHGPAIKYTFRAVT
jgi:hypothetical protein